jgi:hypothetical protein
MLSKKDILWIIVALLTTGAILFVIKVLSTNIGWTYDQGAI